MSAGQSNSWNRLTVVFFSLELLTVGKGGSKVMYVFCVFCEHTQVTRGSVLNHFIHLHPPTGDALRVSRSETHLPTVVSTVMNVGPQSGAMFELSWLSAQSATC